MKQNLQIQQNLVPQQITIIPLEHKFQFLSTLHSKHLNCQLCTQLMLEPLRLHQCGHTFCQSCVGNCQVLVCPLCLQNIQAKQKDLLALKMVGQMPVRCLNNGCPWRGSLEEYNNFHQDGCKLKEHGIDEWLKQVQNTIAENSIGFGALSSHGNENKEQNSHHDENDQSEPKQCSEYHSPHKILQNLSQQESEKERTSKKSQLKLIKSNSQQQQFQIKKQIKQLNYQQLSH